METQRIANKTLLASGGIAKTAEFLNAGLSKTNVLDLKNSGYLSCIRHGYYQLASNMDIQEERILAKLLPEAVLCVESALFHYGYSDFTPRQWSVAVPRTVSRSKLKLEAVPLKFYYIPTELYPLGKTTTQFNDVTLAIYDRERTICDCFKYRTRLDSELFSKALNTYVADPKKNLSNLSQYAKAIGLSEKMNNIMEVLLNG